MYLSKVAVLCALLLGAVPMGVLASDVTLLNAKTDKPLKLKYRKKQEITDAVTAFHTTGENAYSGDEAVLEEGAKLYAKRCKACHAADGSGKVGPSLRDEEWDYARTDTEVGRFEIVYGGGRESMRAFGRQMDQDDILKVLAFLETFRNGQTPAMAVEETDKTAAAGQSVPPVPFTAAFLSDKTNIDAGGEMWAAQCRHCHGAKAYPGKAPKLKPAKYKADWVYRRVTDGFRKMPAWKDEYSDEERMKIVSYILSGSFSP